MILALSYVNNGILSSLCWQMPCEVDSHCQHSYYIYIYRIISQIRLPRDNPPPPNRFDENYCAGIIISEDFDCD